MYAKNLNSFPRIKLYSKFSQIFHKYSAKFFHIFIKFYQSFFNRPPILAPLNLQKKFKYFSNVPQIFLKFSKTFDNKPSEKGPVEIPAVSHTAFRDPDKQF